MISIEQINNGDGGLDVRGKINNSFTNIETLDNQVNKAFVPSEIIDGYMLPTGLIQPSPNTKALILRKVKIKDKRLRISTYSRYSAAAIIYYDANDSIISTVTDVIYTDKILIAPSNAIYADFSSYNVGAGEVPFKFEFTVDDSDANSNRNSVMSGDYNSLIEDSIGFLTITGLLSGDQNSKLIRNIKVIAGESFLYFGKSEFGVASVVFYDAVGNVIGYVNDVENVNTPTIRKVVVPVGAVYMDLCSYEPDATQPQLSVHFLNAVGNYEIDAQLSIGKLDNFSSIIEEDGHLAPDGSFVYETTERSLILRGKKVVEGETILYTGKARFGAAAFVFYNDLGVVVGSNSDAWGYNVPVVVPTDAVTMDVASFDYDIENHSRPMFFKLVFKDRFKNSNVLTGKKYIACGDSFTEGDFTDAPDDSYKDLLIGELVYPQYIAKKNDMNVLNFGKNGSTMALSKEYVDGTETDINFRNPFSNTRYLDIPLDSDYITMWFGINDSVHTYLGTLSDTDNTTFYGAFNVVLEYIITNMPFAKLGIVVTDGAASPSFRDAIREVAIKWGVPVLDMYNDVNVPLMINGRDASIPLSATAKSLRDAAFTVSPTNDHPNQYAHEYRSTVVSNFLKSL